MLGCIWKIIMRNNKRNIIVYVVFVCLQYMFVSYIWFYTDTPNVGVERSVDINAAEYEFSSEKNVYTNQASLETFMQSGWMKYRNEWNEELVSMSGLVVNFSPKYWETMQMKGSHWLTDKYSEFKQRYRQMEKNCNVLRDSNNTTVTSIDTAGRRLIFVDRYELLGCSIPKASSSTMSRVYTKLDQGLIESQRHSGYTGGRLNISIANNLDAIHQNVKRIQTYLRIVLTRHPFSWLGSKYHFTIDNSANKEFQRENCPGIIKQLYLKRFPTDEKMFIKKYKVKMDGEDFQEKLLQIRRYNAGPGKYSVSLFEYIQWLILTHERKSEDVRFTGQNRLCNPCAMHYDVILQCTNGYEEINRVLDFLQRDKTPERRLYYPKGSPTVSQQKCNEEFSAIPIEIRRKLHKVYEMDFLLFGYDFQDDPNNPNACY